MEIEKQKIFIRATVCFARSGNLNLTNEQLRSLYKECIALARYLGDVLANVAASLELAVVTLELSLFEEAITLLRLLLDITQRNGHKEMEGASCSRLGFCYQSLGQHDEALNHYKMALDIAKQIGEEEEEGVAHGSIGSCYSSLGQYEKALNHYEMALDIADQIGDKAGEGGAHGSIGSCYCSLGQYEKALNHYEMALDIAKQIGDKAGEGVAHGIIGSCSCSLGQYEQALNHYEMALDIAKQIREKKGEGVANGHIGNCYKPLGQYEKALNRYEMALDIAKQIRDKAGEGGAHGNIASCYYLLGHYKKALNHFEMVLNIAKPMFDEQAEVTYSVIGRCCYLLGLYDKALNHNKIALDIAKQIRDKAGEKVAYGSIGNCYYSLGKYNEALNHYKMALDIAKQTRDKKGEGLANGYIGNCYNLLGQYEKALNHCEIALDIAKEIRDEVGEGVANGHICSCYHILGQYDKALNNSKMALNMAKQTGDKVGQGRGFFGVGTCYYSLGECEKALSHLEMGLDIAKQIGDKATEGAAYGVIGVCHCSLKRYEKALNHCKMALEMAKQIGDKKLEVFTHSCFGHCYCSLRQYNKALYHYNMDLDIAKRIEDKAEEAKTYGERGVCFYALGQYDKAEFNARDSIQCFEELVQNAPKEDRTRISFRDTFYRYFDLLTKTLVLQGKFAEALVIAEKGRARALAELIVKRYSVQCDEITQTNALNFGEIRKVVRSMGSTVLFMSFQANGIYQWLVKPDGSMIFETNSEMLYDRVVEMIYKFRNGDFIVKCEDRSLVFLYPETKSEETEKRMRSEFLHDIAVPKLQVSSGFPHSPETRKLKVNTNTTSPVCAAAFGHRNIFEEPEDEIAGINPLEELYRVILGPIRKFVEWPELIVVPDGPLHFVPFSALMNEGRQHDSDSLQVRLIPSLTTAKIITSNRMEHGGQGDPLIVAPTLTLPGANEEVRMVSRFFNTQPLTGKEATKEKFLQELENANLIHIAGHGDMERGEILFSTNVASADGIAKLKREDKLLTMSDLVDKRLRAKLVVLSCCYSAHGKVCGEGVVGIARSFLGAGASSVLVALWAIDDEATLYFMTKFYEHLTRGVTACESLNRAMVSMRETTEYRDPHYWAPFVLIGDNVTVSTLAKDEIQVEPKSDIQYGKAKDEIQVEPESDIQYGKAKVNTVITIIFVVMVMVIVMVIVMVMS